MWQLRLILNENDYVTLEQDKDKDVIIFMLKWYESHKRFFNGTFEIVKKEN